MSFRDAQGIEGPYWDYSKLSDWCDSNASMYARMATRCLLDGDTAQAKRYAADFATFDALNDRIQARYKATKDQDAVSWIGWRF